MSAIGTQRTFKPTLIDVSLRMQGRHRIGVLRIYAKDPKRTPLSCLIKELPVA